MLAYLDPNSGGTSIGPVEVIVLLVIYLLPAILVARYAANKGHSFGLFLLLGLLFSWLIALIVAVIVEDRTKPRRVVVEQGPDDHLDRLKKLTELRDAGTLSPEEFEAEKARILGD